MQRVHEDGAAPVEEDWGAIEDDQDNGSGALSFDNISAALGVDPEEDEDSGHSQLVSNSSEAYFDDDESDHDENDTHNSDEDEFHEFEFAVGPKTRGGSTCEAAHDFFCPTCPRVGNMIICHENKRADGSRQLNCVFGPCWPFMFLLTLPLIVGISSVVSSLTWKYTTPALRAVFIGTACLTVLALFCTSFRDPGIMKRHHRRPKGVARHHWRYSDQGQTFRPPGAMYSEDAEVVLEEFDHVCPWTGTAIARKNITCFYAFVGLIYVLIIMVAVVMFFAAQKFFDDTAFNHHH